LTTHCHFLYVISASWFTFIPCFYFLAWVPLKRLD
jgi:hypothetical protein